MFEVIINGSFIVLKQSVGVAQTVTGLSLHCLILQKPGQLQSPPEGETEEEEKKVKECLGWGQKNDSYLLVSLFHSSRASVQKNFECISPYPSVPVLDCRD